MGHTTSGFFLGKAGFSLMELLIVVVIVGILSSAAIPAYQVYIQKSRMAEIFNVIGPAQTAAGEYAMTHQGFTGFSTAYIANMVSSRYINKISVINVQERLAVLSVELSPKIVKSKSQKIYFSASYQDTGISWACEIPKESTEVLSIAPSLCVQIKTSS